MFNFYRWFPKMKVVFTAPTKPLVAQQIEACYNICGITQKDSVELTGAQSQASRVNSWATKRVFYLTPQVLENDLKSGLVNARDVACIVIDEAHRAQKAYSYVNVVKALYKDNPLVRVLALSATPGTTIQNVQSVVTNLNIARIEFRTEDALDIRPYTFDKEVDKIIVPPGPAIEEMATGLKKLIAPYLERLNSKGGYWSKDPDKANVYQLLEARNNFRARSEERGSRESQVAEGEFALCISLLRILELLIKYGFTTFYTKITEWLAESGPDAPKYRQQLARNPMFIELLRKTESIVNSPDYHSNFKSHPKVGHLFQYLKRHFELQETAALDGSQQTKVMIFAQFRETVEEVVATLAPLSPAVRPMAFVGQASTKSGKGLKQKDQIEVISKFKRGGYNVLVCTSIGEEGLDIGEVDLIVCYDSSNSPIRMLQRMGRTGRRRKGRVCMLLTQGKEERSFGTSKSTHKSVLKGIKEGNIQYYNLNPRMLPEGVNPTCVKKHIEIPPYQPVSASTKGTSRKSTTHGLTPDQLDHFYEMYGAAIPIVPSLTRYPVQQCHPGLTHRVRHSNRTKTFVEIMRMCDNAVSNCEESLLDTKHILPKTCNPTAPDSSAQTTLPNSTALKPPPENHSLPEKHAHFLEGISLSSLSDDDLFVLPNLPAPPPKIPWSDIDSRIKLIFNRHAALTKRSKEILTSPFKPATSMSPHQSTDLNAAYQSIDPKNNQQPILQSPTCDAQPETAPPKPDFNRQEELFSDDFLDCSFDFDTITDTLPAPRPVLEDLNTHPHAQIPQHHQKSTTNVKSKLSPPEQAFSVPNDLFSDDFLDNSSLFDTILDALPEPHSNQGRIAIQSPVQTARQQPRQSPARRFKVKMTPPKLDSTTPQVRSASHINSPSNSQPSQQEPSLLETPVQVSRRRPRQGLMILSGTPSPQTKLTHKRRKLRAEMENFMELEAEESGPGGSSEAESNSGDDADDSFVCGDSEIVRECEEEDHESEMPNIYRQSLLSQNNIAEGFYTRPNQFGRQKANLRYVASNQPPVTNDSQDQDDSFVVDDSEPVGSEEWTDEQEPEALDEDQANARLQSILDIPDTQTDPGTNPILSQTYAEAAAALSASDPPPIPPTWQRHFKP
ncbi:hypothetical protein DSO57_1024503 [Entomophthora muscae]|uniref:Uncharacterized protein n=1 Tax=Entomophthora muscae TaxID=34485 RepID=A0ACC2T2X6_9FUNG|nr:hypothetical protein DSO57_1024503 [Entomophthora muscae]